MDEVCAFRIESTHLPLLNEPEKHVKKWSRSEWEPLYHASFFRLYETVMNEALPKMEEAAKSSVMLSFSEWQYGMLGLYVDVSNQLKTQAVKQD